MIKMPDDPTQWYNKNDHKLFRTEVAAMRKYFPNAGFGFMKLTGNMYWVINMNISQLGFTQTWRLMLIYDKDHPHYNTYGGSIKVLPIKPNATELKEMAKKYGRPGVPHLLYTTDFGTSLCVSYIEDKEYDNVDRCRSATAIAARAAKWALYFELGIRDEKVWNKWCGDMHFKHFKI